MNRFRFLIGLPAAIIALIALAIIGYLATRATNALPHEFLCGFAASRDREILVNGGIPAFYNEYARKQPRLPVLRVSFRRLDSRGFCGLGVSRGKFLLADQRSGVIIDKGNPTAFELPNDSLIGVAPRFGRGRPPACAVRLFNGAFVLVADCEKPYIVDTATAKVVAVIEVTRSNRRLTSSLENGGEAAFCFDGEECWKWSPGGEVQRVVVDEKFVRLPASGGEWWLTAFGRIRNAAKVDLEVRPSFFCGLAPGGAKAVCCSRPIVRIERSTMAEQRAVMSENNGAPGDAWGAFAFVDLATGHLAEVFEARRIWPVQGFGFCFVVRGDGKTYPGDGMQLGERQDLEWRNADGLAVVEEPLRNLGYLSVSPNGYRVCDQLESSYLVVFCGDRCVRGMLFGNHHGSLECGAGNRWMVGTANTTVIDHAGRSHFELKIDGSYDGIEHNYFRWSSDDRMLLLFAYDQFLAFDLSDL